MQEVYGGLISNPRNRMGMFNNIAVTRTFAGNVVNGDIPGMDNNSSEDDSSQTEEPASYEDEVVGIELETGITAQDLLDGVITFKIDTEDSRYGIVAGQVIAYHDNKLYITVQGTFVYRIDGVEYNPNSSVEQTPTNNIILVHLDSSYSSNAYHIVEAYYTDTEEQIDYNIKSEPVSVSPANMLSGYNGTLTFGEAVTDQEIIDGLRVFVNGVACSVLTGSTITYMNGSDAALYIERSSGDASATRTVHCLQNITLQSYIYKD